MEPNLKKIGILGGSFDPSHSGHIAISEACFSKIKLNEIWWVITESNPEKSKSYFSYLERYQIAKEITKFHNYIKMPYSESEISQINSPYTSRMIDFLTTNYSHIFFLIFGQDVFARIHCWENWKDIFEKMAILVIERPGWKEEVHSCPAAKEFSKLEISLQKDKERYNKFICGKTKGWLLIKDYSQVDISSSSIKKNL